MFLNSVSSIYGNVVFSIELSIDKIMKFVRF